MRTNQRPNQRPHTVTVTKKVGWLLGDALVVLSGGIMADQGALLATLCFLRVVVVVVERTREDDVDGLRRDGSSAATREMLGHVVFNPTWLACV